MDRLQRDFFARPTLDAARDLLGCTLVRMLNGERLSAQLVEVEAYVGESDRASHASAGRTERNRVMYGKPGLLYVYFTYGMHYCMNVVTEQEGFPAAVLLRAAHPLEGISLMTENRNGRPLEELTNGPAKLCQALGVDKEFNGEDLCTSTRIWIERGEPVEEDRIATGPRIGVERAGEAADYPWRLWIKGDRFVSRRSRTRSS